MPDELPEAKVIAKPNKISGVIAASILLIAIATVVGFVVAYISALLVVKVGLPVPKLVVGAPLVIVGMIAWATTIGLNLRDGVITIVVAAVIAVGLIVAWQPPDPARMFAHESKVTDVKVHGDDATLTFESKTGMSEMPGAGMLAGYAALLAAFALIASTLGHGVNAARKKKQRAF